MTGAVVKLSWTKDVVGSAVALTSDNASTGMIGSSWEASSLSPRAQVNSRTVSNVKRILLEQVL